jgi:hypothetical protein
MPAMEYYKNINGLVESITIKNSVYEYGNDAHE